ncbi:MAG: phosphoribosylformylglycinamidine synthase subunit PurS [Bacteroides sp.]
MKFEVQINVMPQRALLDPQGKAVLGTIHQLGYSSVADVRMGKHIVMEIEAENEGRASQIAGELCSKLLSNPVMESFEYSVEAIK